MKTIHLPINYIKKYLLILIVVSLLFENLLLLYNNFQTKTPVLGLRINGVNISTLTKDKIEKVIEEEKIKNNRPLKLYYKNDLFNIYPSEVGAKIDSKNLSSQIISIGRIGTIWKKFVDQNEILFTNKNIQLKGGTSQALLTITLLDLQSKINKDANFATLDFKSPDLKTIPARDGIKINTNKLTVLILDNIFNPQALPIEIPVIKTFPDPHSQEELNSIKKTVPNYLKSPLSIESGGLIFTLTPEDIKDLLTIVERPDPKNPKKTILTLRLDDVKLNKKLGEFAKKLETKTHAEFDDHDARVAIYAQFYGKQKRAISIPTGRNLTGKSVLAAKSDNTKIVYLTFDDGPNSVYHPLILDILKTYNIKATFFLVGTNAQRDLAVAKRTSDDGHIIGNHSLTHSFLPNFSSTFILKELSNTNDILKPFNKNQSITLFRPPYGGVNTYVKKNADDLGMRLYLWDVDPRDWSEPETNELVRRVVDNAFDGADILLHSNHLSTVKALPKIIDNLKTQGYTFQTLK